MNINPPLTDQLPSLLALPTAARAKRYDVTDQRRTLSLDYRGPASAGSRGTLRINGAGERERDRDRERQRDRDRETHMGVCSRVWQIFIFYHSVYILS